MKSDELLLSEDEKQKRILSGEVLQVSPAQLQRIAIQEAAKLGMTEFDFIADNNPA